MIPLPLSAKVGIGVALLAGAVGLGWQARGRWDGATVARLEGEVEVLRLRVGVTDRNLDSAAVRVGQLEQALGTQNQAILRITAEQRARDAEAARLLAAERERADRLQAEYAVRPLPEECDAMVRQLAVDLTAIWSGGGP